MTRYHVLSQSPENHVLVHRANAETVEITDSRDKIDPNLKVKFEIDTSYNFQLHDFFFSSLYPIFSTRIKLVLDQFNFGEGVQFIKARISYNRKKYDDYWYMHIPHRYNCLDTINSIYTTLEGENIIVKFEKLVLDLNKLEKMQEFEKFIFGLAEDSSIYIVHESVVDAVMKVNPTGLKFYIIDKWYTYITQDEALKIQR